jgi:hypothetical protein
MAAAELDEARAQSQYPASAPMTSPIRAAVKMVNSSAIAALGSTPAATFARIAAAALRASH